MSKGAFITSLVQSIQSIYWSIYSIYSLIHSIDLFNLFNLMSLVQSIDLSIVFYQFNPFIYPLALARLIQLSIYYTLFVQSSCLSIAFILLLVAIKSSSEAQLLVILFPVSSSLVKLEYNHPIFLLGGLFIGPFMVHIYNHNSCGIIFQNSWYTYGYLYSNHPMIISSLFAFSSLIVHFFCMQ